MSVEPQNRASERLREDGQKFGDVEFVESQARELLADYFVREDRRRVVGVPETDADGYIEQALALHHLGSGSPRIWIDRVIAVRGERLALYIAGFEYTNSLTNQMLAITQYDAQVDLMERFITFDPDDLGAALAELDQLRASLEAGTS